MQAWFFCSRNIRWDIFMNNNSKVFTPSRFNLQSFGNVFWKSAKYFLARWSRTCFVCMNTFNPILWYKIVILLSCLLPVFHYNFFRKLIPKPFGLNRISYLLYKPNVVFMVCLSSMSFVLIFIFFDSSLFIWSGINNFKDNTKIYDQ